MMSQQLGRKYSDEEQEAVFYPCPRCLREVGDRCVDPNGQRRSLHQDRVELIRRPIEENIALARVTLAQLNKSTTTKIKVVTWQAILAILLERQSSDCDW